ncbi:patatin-like phospholipase domain-containing protein 4 [Sorex fumeus]|uniref:patatin-like phospholipase domain-containing protein 4 n=1 Tax=Sorex fumeus TaxID=62283 RepID=UPI0024AD9B81|nr:patatin-like phospholipase domain-containing protein 4 [Sorex fumeus]
MKHINLSFAACGFLGIYHLGAASALCKHGSKLLKDMKAFAGASAGSLAFTVLLTAPQKLEECKAFIYTFAEEIRGQSLGAVKPSYDFVARLRCGMESILPAKAHQLAHRRLHLSITNTRTRQNYLVSSFSSQEDLIKVLLASSFVPIYTGLTLVKYKGQILPNQPSTTSTICRPINCSANHQQIHTDSAHHIPYPPSGPPVICSPHMPHPPQATPITCHTHLLLYQSSACSLPAIPTVCFAHASHAYSSRLGGKWALRRSAGPQGEKLGPGADPEPGRPPRFGTTHLPPGAHNSQTPAGAREA